MNEILQGNEALPNGLGTGTNWLASKGSCLTDHITGWTFSMVFNDNPITVTVS